MVRPPTLLAGGPRLVIGDINLAGGPRLAIGTMNLAGEGRPPREAAHATLHAALDEGAR